MNSSIATSTTGRRTSRNSSSTTFNSFAHVNHFPKSMGKNFASRGRARALASNTEARDQFQNWMADAGARPASISVLSDMDAYKKAPDTRDWGTSHLIFHASKTPRDCSGGNTSRSDCSVFNHPQDDLLPETSDVRRVMSARAGEHVRTDRDHLERKERIKLRRALQAEGTFNLDPTNASAARERRQKYRQQNANARTGKAGKLKKRNKNSHMRPTSAHISRCNTPTATSKFFQAYRGYGKGTRPSTAQSARDRDIW